MLVSSTVHCIAVLIFQLGGVQTLSPITSCPASCLCEKSSVVNCASLGLSKAPSHIPATATALDLSHNALHALAPLGSGHMHLQGLQHLRLGNNSLKSLSMCSGIRGTLTKRHQRCVSWAPDLQLLSADRNQLKCLPRGLGNIKSLKVLQLSHNRISEIGPADLAGCTHLSELKIHHNLITTIHPEAFKDLQELKILDLSYNLLSTIPVPTYLSLRNLNTLVDISGNRWRCDCNLKTIQRWLSFDRELGNPTWDVVCFSPSNHAGKDLLYLQESDLTCPPPVYKTPGVKQEVTVDEGKEFILSCSTDNQDFMHTRWWTPHGQIFDSQQFLHISNTTEYDAGLYVCVSGYQTEHVSIFTVHVRKIARYKRLRREAQIGSIDPLNRANDDYMQRNVPAVRAVQQSHFVLAVCLSVFITFVVAFVLGVILRPYLEKWYKQSLNKRNSNMPPSNLQTSSTRQRPYVNEGYSDTDDQEYEVHEGPRVTFGEVTEIQEQGSVPYYVTVEESQSENDTSVAGVYENVGKGKSMAGNIEVHKEVPLGEENTERFAERSNEMQFEYIPDPEDSTEFKERSISPALSLIDEHQEAQTSYEARESIEQSVDSPTVSMIEEGGQASTDHHATIPGFITDPFPLKMFESQEEIVDELDPDLWNDSGDSFSFTEGSPRSSSRVLYVAELQKEMSVDELSDRRSSCNSCESGESEGGPTEYTVSPDDQESISFSENGIDFVEKDIQTKDRGSQFRQDTITLDPTDIYMTYPRGDSIDDEQFAEYKEYLNSSNISSDHEDDPTLYNVHPVYRPSQKTTSVIAEDESRSSSYIEDEENKQGDYPRRLEIRLEHEVPSTDATPVVNPDRILTLNYDNSSSSTDIEDKSSKEKDRGIFKGLSGLSAMLFNRGGSEADKKASQSGSKTATTNSKGTGGFLGISFKKQPATPSDNVSPTTDEDNFFATIGQAFDRLPKLNKSLLFSISVPKPPNQQESTAITDRTSESQRPSFDEGIFGKIDPTLDPIPRVKRYLHFSHSRSYEEASDEDIIITEVVNSESKRPHENDAIATTKDDVVKLESVTTTESPSDKFGIFFGGQSISLQTIPMVQRYVEFRQTELQSVQELTPTFREDSFFEQFPICFDEVPKVKQYIQFFPSVSLQSNLSTPVPSINQVSRLESVPKTESPPNAINIFFEGQNTSLKTIPKVQRYIEFTQTEPKTVQELTTNFKEDSFFEQFPISFDEVSKVKQYIQFSRSESQRTCLSPPSVSINQVSRLESVPKTETPSNTFNIFFKGQSTSVQAIPKVQRYVEFRQVELQTVQELTPTFKEDRFFDQIPISFDEVPKVKQYIQFSPSESEQSSVSTPSVPINQVVKLKTVPQAESTSDNINIFFEGQNISLQTIPKVQRYVEFLQIAPQTVQELTPTFKGDSFFEQIPITFDEVPKVKQYIQFLPSESQQSSVSTPSVSINQVPKLESVPKTESPTDKICIFFGEQSVSLQTIPKVQRYVAFRQTEPQTLQELTPTFTKNSFFEQFPIAFDEVPKVKQYIQFFPSVSQQSNLTTPPVSIDQIVRPESVPKTESSSNTINIFFGGQKASLQVIPKVQRYVEFQQIEPQTVQKLTPNIKTGSFFGQIPISFDEVPKVTRHLLFSQSEPHYQTLSPDHPIENKYSVHDEQITPSLVTKVHAPPQNTEDNFFEEIAVSVNGAPKVKKYIQFVQSEKVSETHLPLQETIPIPAKRNNLPSKEFNPVVDEHNFFGQIGVSFDEIPKVRRRIYFTEHLPLPPESQPPTLRKQPVTPAITAKETSHSISGTKSRQAKPNFFEGIHVSPDNMPKIKRSLKFTQYKAESSNQSVPSFFGQIEVSLDEVPKVKRYLQVIKSEPQSPSASAITENVTPELVTRMNSQRSEAEASPSIKDDNFFGQIGSSFDAIPKVKRHIKFTEAEPHTQSQMLHPLTDRTEKPIHAASELISTDQPAAGEHHFFGPIGTSFDIQKVKRYIQFSEHFPDSSSLPLHRQTATPVLSKSELQISSPSPAGSKSNNEDPFFREIDAAGSGLPKVKRYIQFTHQHSMSLNTNEITADAAKKTELLGPAFSKVDLQTPPTEDKFFGQIGTTLNSLPRVKRFIQFTQSEPYPTSQSTSTPAIAERLKPEILTKMQSTRSEAQSVKEDGFFGQTGASIDGLPKVTRYLKFTKSEPYSSSHSQSLTEEMTKKQTTISSLTYNDVKLSTKSSHAADNRYGSLYYNHLPKVKRHVQPYQPTISLSRSNLESEPILPSEGEFEVTTKEIVSFGQIDGVPLANRYTPFKQYNPHHLPPSISYKAMEVGTESRMFKTNVTPANVGDYLPQQTSTRAEMSNQFDTNQALSQIQDSPSAIKETPETSRLNQLPKPKTSPFSSKLDKQPDHVDVLKRTGSNLSSGDKIFTNTQGSSSRTPVSHTTDPENILEIKLSSLSASFNESDPLQTRKRLVMDPAFQDVSQSDPDTPAASLEKDDTREYLRDSSLARQRHERRRLLFQQKKRAMDGFSLNSESFTSQESDQ